MFSKFLLVNLYQHHLEVGLILVWASLVCLWMSKNDVWPGQRVICSMVTVPCGNKLIEWTIIRPGSYCVKNCSEFVFDPVKWPREQMDEDFMKLSRMYSATRSVVRVPDLDPKFKISVLASKQVWLVTFLSLSLLMFFMIKPYLSCSRTIVW